MFSTGIIFLSLGLLNCMLIVIVCTYVNPLLYCSNSGKNFFEGGLLSAKLFGKKKKRLTKPISLPVCRGDRPETIYLPVFGDTSASVFASSRSALYLPCPGLNHDRGRPVSRIYTLTRSLSWDARVFRFPSGGRVSCFPRSCLVLSLSLIFIVRREEIPFAFFAFHVYHFIYFCVAQRRKADAQSDRHVVGDVKNQVARRERRKARMAFLCPVRIRRGKKKKCK